MKIAQRLGPTGRREVTVLFNRLRWLHRRCKQGITDPADGLTADEVLWAVGVGKSEMTDLEFYLYGMPGGLTEAQKDEIWNRSHCPDRGQRHAA